jgi:hypothetical protein
LAASTESAICKFLGLLEATAFLSHDHVQAVFSDITGEAAPALLVRADGSARIGFVVRRERAQNLLPAATGLDLHSVVVVQDFTDRRLLGAGH